MLYIQTYGAKMRLNIAGVARDSIVDGPGMRLTVFVQGCRRKCSHCHNPEAWDFNGGYLISLDDILSMYREQYQGVTISGGEPLDQDERQTAALLSLASSIHAHGGDVWAYSGHYLESLQAGNHPLLGCIDVLVDGNFEYKLRDYNLRFRGSSNQRILVKNKEGEWRDVSYMY